MLFAHGNKVVVVFGKQQQLRMILMFHQVCLEESRNKRLIVEFEIKN